MVTVGVGMSGGLDSAVTAHRLLTRTDVDLFGFTMRIGDLEAQHDRTCCSIEDLMDAKQMCDDFGIPHYTLDVEQLFKESVVEPFVEGYKRGHTPNPCVWCNRSVKIGYLVEKVRKLGGDYVAMGHYVRRSNVDGEPALYRGLDSEKDQSYYLAFVNREYLGDVWFPIGDFNKDQVREYAKENGLLVAEKQESQSICFVPNMDYKQFIEDYSDSEPEPGEIRNIDGEVIGEHDGIINYTIGQRRGLGISHHNPLYVLKILPEENALIVGERDRLEQRQITVGPINWLTEEPPEDCLVQIRYNGSPVPCEVQTTEGPNNEIRLDEPEEGVSSGQIAVFYTEDGRMLGGSVIHEAPMPYERDPDISANVRPKAVHA